MSIKIGNVSTRITYDVTTEFTPIKLDILENVNSGTIENNFGRNQYNKKSSIAEITLEFDALAESTGPKALYKIINNRQYEKKLFLNHPANTLQLIDFFTPPGNTKISYERQMFDFPPSSIVTEFTSNEYLKIRNIDTLYWNNSAIPGAYNYVFVCFTFDLTNYLAAYNIDSIDRLTLFLHNPYCLTTGTQSGYKIYAYIRTGAYLYDWIEIGSQSLSVSDVDLRAVNKMNQQFYSIKKVQDFSKVADFIDTNGSPAFGANTVTFMMKNSVSWAGANLDLGFNYVGLAINGYGVKQTNEDNFTFREPYTGAGYTGTVVLSEV
jgi:hypothetical protein